MRSGKLEPGGRMRKALALYAGIGRYTPIHGDVAICRDGDFA